MRRLPFALLIAAVLSACSPPESAMPQPAAAEVPPAPVAAAPPPVTMHFRGVEAPTGQTWGDGTPLRVAKFAVHNPTELTWQFRGTRPAGTLTLDYPSVWYYSSERNGPWEPQFVLSAEVYIPDAVDVSLPPGETLDLMVALPPAMFGAVPDIRWKVCLHFRADDASTSECSEPLQLGTVAGAPTIEHSTNLCDIDLEKAFAGSPRRIRGRFRVDTRHGSTIVGDGCPGHGAPVVEFPELIAPDFHRAAFAGGGKTFDIVATVNFLSGVAEDSRPRVMLLQVHAFAELPADEELAE